MSAEGRAAEGILACLAQLSADPLPEPLFDRAAGAAAPAPFDLELLVKALEELEGAGDLERTGKRLRVPEAVRERLRAELEYEDAVRATDQALALVLAAFPADPGDYRNWKRARSLMPALRAGIERAVELEVASHRVPLALALSSEFMTASGDLVLAKELAEDAFLHSSSSLEPDVQATMNRALGVALAQLGDLEPARQALEEALGSRPEAGDTDEGARRGDLLALGEVLGELGEFDAARGHLEQARSSAEIPIDRFDAQARRRLAWLLMEEGELERAEHAYCDALEASRGLFGDDHPDTALVHGELGAFLLEVSRWEEARAELDRALESACALLGEGHPAVGVIASNLGGALEGLERFAEAREAVERSLAVGRTVLPEGHRNLWLRHRKLARILRALDEYEAARAHAEEAARISERALSPEDPEAARDQLTLATLLRRMGEPVSARQRFESALPILEAVEPRDSPEIVGHQLTFGELLIVLGDLVAARPPLADALAGSENLDEDVAARARIALLWLGERLTEELATTLELQGHRDDADRARDEDRKLRRAVLEEMLAGEEIGPILLAARAAGSAMPDLAEAALSRARALAEANGDSAEREKGLLAVRLAWSSLGLDAYRSEDYEASRRFYETALELAAGDPAAEADALNDLGDIAGAKGDDAGAAETYRKALAKSRAVGEGEVVYTLLLLGRALSRLGQHEEAEECFSERLEILRGGSERRPLAEAATLDDLADVRVERGEFESAIELYGEAAELKREAGNAAELAVSLRALGGALRRVDRFAEAADAYTESTRLLRDLPDADPMFEAVALQEYADLRRESGDLAAAESLYRRAIARATPEREPLFFSYLLFGLAAVLEGRGDPAGAEKALQHRLEILSDLEDVDWQEGISLVDLGRIREAAGQLPEAIGFYRDAAAKLAGPAERGHAFALHKLADALVANRELGKAVAVYEKAFEAWNAEGEPELASRVLLDLGRTQYALKDLAAAAGSFERRIDYLAKAEKPNRRAEGFTLHDLADVRRAEGRSQEAIDLYRRAIARKREGEGEVELAASLILLAVTLLGAGEAGEPEEAAALGEEALAILRQDPDPNPTLLGPALVLSAAPHKGEPIAVGVERLRKLAEERTAPEVQTALLEVLQTLGRKATLDGDLADAETLFRQRLALLAEQPERGPNPEGITKHELAYALELAGRTDEAVALYREAAALKRQAGNELGVARTLFALANQMRKEDAEGARALAAESVELFRRQQNAGPVELSTALSLLAVLEEEDQPALAALAEAKQLVGSLPDDSGQVEAVQQRLAKAEEAIRNRPGRPG